MVNPGIQLCAPQIRWIESQWTARWGIISKDMQKIQHCGKIVKSLFITAKLKLFQQHRMPKAPKHNVRWDLK
ncbi:hypothetical protein GDO78_011669 [Eleutherodactylus coqui]|uniref:Uncharacterized protein n=1 Tax=Eleutherodactylus coqui TaxID=57060 RepID=A0A8J6F375_ELECQ|nr:hypothetical protein GDO78_011669 [Eleutherodactylus coqui]